MSVDPELITFQRNRKKIIGYTGFGHTQDLESIENVLLEILNEYPDWHLELIGTMVPSERLCTLGDRLLLIPPEREYDAFISLLKSRNWSIGICPLVNNRFNAFKANNKWIEYSCCNIATIASDLDPYRYGSPKTAYCFVICLGGETLRKLINSTDLVDNLVLKAQNVIRERYSNAALSHQVYNIFKELC